MDIAKIQALLQDFHLDGWLFSDFQGHDFISLDFCLCLAGNAPGGCFIISLPRGSLSKSSPLSSLCSWITFLAGKFSTKALWDKRKP